MADRGAKRIKSFKPCKIRIRSQSTTGKKALSKIQVRSAVVGAEKTSDGLPGGSLDAVIFDDDHGLDVSNVDEANSRKSEELSKHHQRRLKEFNGWEEIRSSLLSARFEEEVFSSVQICVLCGKSAVCRCTDCGPRQTFCMECAKLQHTERNYFHVLEIYKVSNSSVCSEPYVCELYVKLWDCYILD